MYSVHRRCNAILHQTPVCIKIILRVAPISEAYTINIASTHLCLTVALTLFYDSGKGLKKTLIRNQMTQKYVALYDRSTFSKMLREISLENIKMFFFCYNYAKVWLSWLKAGKPKSWLLTQTKIFLLYRAITGGAKKIIFCVAAYACVHYVMRLTTGHCE